MRVVKKLLVDYDDLLSEILHASDTDDLMYFILLHSAKTDIERVYGDQCSNYSVLVTGFEDGHFRSTIVPRDYQL